MRAIVDTGPLVAFLNRNERHGRWVRERIAALETPLLVCEPVLTEAMYLFARHSIAQDALFEFLRNGALSVAFRLQDHIGELREMVRKYRDRPMSLADACIVRMAEINADHVILTLDSDFAVYRKFGRAPLEILHPIIGN